MKSLPKKPPKSTNKKKAFLEAYEATNGNISEACRKANISRDAYYLWRHKDERFAKQCELLEESFLDFAESQLKTQIEQGNLGAICFFLKCKGKKRGYVERQELSGPEGADIPIAQRIDMSSFTSEQLIEIVNAANQPKQITE